MLDDLFGPLDAAIYGTVNGFVDPVTGKRGAVALAPLLGKQPGVLSNKANPEQDHQLTLRESVPLQLVARNFAILHAYSSALHHVAYALPETGNASDMELLDQYAEMQAELGLMAQKLRATLRDRHVSSEEVQQVRAAFEDAVRAGLGLLTRLEALVDDRR